MPPQSRKPLIIMSNPNPGDAERNRAQGSLLEDYDHVGFGNARLLRVKNILFQWNPAAREIETDPEIVSLLTAPESMGHAKSMLPGITMS